MLSRTHFFSRCKKWVWYRSQHMSHQHIIEELFLLFNWGTKCAFPLIVNQNCDRNCELQSEEKNINVKICISLKLFALTSRQVRHSLACCFHGVTAKQAPWGFRPHVSIYINKYFVFTRVYKYIYIYTVYIYSCYSAIDLIDIISI